MGSLGVLCLKLPVFYSIRHVIVASRNHIRAGKTLILSRISVVVTSRRNVKTTENTKYIPSLANITYRVCLDVRYLPLCDITALKGV
jgi:hypothetical protein